MKHTFLATFRDRYHSTRISGQEILPWESGTRSIPIDEQTLSIFGYSDTRTRGRQSFRVNDYRIFLLVWRRRHSSVSRCVVHPAGTIFSASPTPPNPLGQLPLFPEESLRLFGQWSIDLLHARGRAFTIGRCTFGTIDARVSMEKTRGGQRH